MAELIRTPAYEGKEPYIFVSYSHRDSGIVLPLIEELFKRRYRVWYDEGIAPGSEWPHYIEAHMKGCDSALIFVSQNSMNSVYCENELVNGISYGKNIINYSLDGSKHPQLAEYEEINSLDDLISRLDQKLIGDGSGYESSMANRRHFSIWNFLFVLSLLAILLLGAALYGLQKGYFDKWLPGKNVPEQIVIEEKPEENVTIENDTIAQAILEQLGQEDLFETIELEADDYAALREATELSDKTLTYYDLTKCDKEELYLNGCSDAVLELLKYFPALKTLHLSSDKITDLTSLNSCPSLSNVYLNKKCFPLAVPDKHRFTILYEH
ncbi:MAG: TIR domain-containing protein [Erysipelotrichaceae bacterium]|nr:TIR domain-containing protein [Erysipelotrichaceae bacterium]